VITIAVVDYGMGNRRSVQKALEHVGARAEITNDPRRVQDAAGIVLPGVGAFPRAMRNLRALELDGLLAGLATNGKPLLGICLGMQLLFERSEELEPTDGLGLLEGTVTALATGPLRVPHIGWSEVQFHRSSPLTEGLPQTGCAFYHVHSLAARPAQDCDLVATTTYGETFATIVERGSVHGVQFHPEKSSAHGLRMLESFVALCDSGAVRIASRPAA
jgi:imidazole glycerol-phosphate synthase subunit HisH